MILIQDGKRYDEVKFSLENDFEDMIAAAKEMIFRKVIFYFDEGKCNRI